jgi:ATP-dependent helicase HrpA
VPNEARRADARSLARLVFKHDTALPISARRQEITEALRRHQVLIVADITATARNWFAEARAVRRLLEDPRVRSYSELAEESHAHLRRLLNEEKLIYISADWIRQLPRYLKAEERRWQRLLARGSEPPAIGRELKDWSARAQKLDAQVSAELRWLAQLDEFHAWVEEYRVSLYAQELRTLGPVSAPRLSARAAEIKAWVTR